MNNKITYTTIGIIIGVAGSLLVTKAVPTNYTSQNNQRGMMANSSQIDSHFIEQMIPHHEDAITMAKLALTKSTREEILTLSKSIIDSQGKEIAQMEEWYQKWYGKQVPNGIQTMQNHGMVSSNSNMHMGMMGDEDDFDSLSDAKDFDKEFINEMIPHHQMAVMMANMLKASTQRPEMKKLAEDIISAQTKEINQMRLWLKEWDI